MNKSDLNLPYNTNIFPFQYLCVEKMGKVYELPVKMMENKELDVYHKYALSLGLKSKIGG